MAAVCVTSIHIWVLVGLIIQSGVHHWACCNNCNDPTLTLVMEQLGKEEAQSATAVNVDRTQVVEETSTTLIVVVVMSNRCVILDVLMRVCQFLDCVGNGWTALRAVAMK